MINLGAIQTCLTSKFPLVYSVHIIYTNSFHHYPNKGIYSIDQFFTLPIVKNLPRHSQKGIVDRSSLLLIFLVILSSSRSLDNIFKQAKNDKIQVMRMTHSADQTPHPFCGTTQDSIFSSTNQYTILVINMFDCWI